jgi:hypothetical protein
VQVFDRRSHGQIVARPALLRPVLDPLCNGQVLGEVLDCLAQSPPGTDTRYTCVYAVHIRVPKQLQIRVPTYAATQKDSRSRDQPEPGAPPALPHFALINTSRSAPKSSPCTVSDGGRTKRLVKPREVRAQRQEEACREGQKCLHVTRHVTRV